MESEAVSRCLGNEVPVSSTKPIHGHLLGAAGATEMLIAMQTVREGLIPHTLNLEEPEAGIAVNLVRHEPLTASVEFALSNSFGFGGHNAVLAVGPPPA
jgi:3-oxoacyl-(acyl-carrier-protein) synthase